MKAKELKRVLSIVDDDAEIEFALENEKEELTAVDSIAGRVNTSWYMPERGELATGHSVSQTMLIILADPRQEGGLEPSNA